MKNGVISHWIVLLIIVIGSASCTNTAITPTPNTVMAPTQIKSVTQSPVPQSTPTDAPTPTETVLPTPTPEPLTCTIAFDSDRDSNREIYRMAPDGSALNNLSNHPAEDSDPAWSPDGSQIAFVSNRENNAEGGQFIYIMDADGGNVHQLTLENESKWPDWSHDGSSITYTHHGDIYITKADGSAQSINLTNSPEEDEQSTWSPDGKKIAWLSKEQGGWNIFIMDADGNHQQKLTNNGQVYSIQWTIDGQLFSIWDHPEGLCFKCVMNADGSNIMEAGGKGELQRFLPFKTLNGDRVECIGADNVMVPDSEIYLVGEMYPDIFLNLTNNPANDRNPDWPTNCLSGFEGVFPEVSTVPVIEPTPSSSELVFGYAGDKPELKERARAMQIACNELGIQCVYGEIPELIEMGVNAIIQNADKDSVDGLRDDILNARDHQIPVFLLDAETNAEGAYSVTIDYDLWAQTSFEWMLEKIGGKGQIAYFDLAPDHRYTDMIQKLLSRYPNISVVEFRDGKYDPEKIKPETSDFVNMYPDLKAIWTSYSNFQAMTGLEYNKIPYEKWPVMVCEANRDGLLTWERIQAAYPSFDCFASVNPPGIAYAAIYAAYYLESGYPIDASVLGGEFGHTLYVNLPTVTMDNFQAKLNDMLQNDTHIVDDWMTPEEIKENWFLE